MRPKEEIEKSDEHDFEAIVSRFPGHVFIKRFTYVKELRLKRELIK